MSSILDRVRPEIRELAPYSAARWDPTLVRLHANENPWRAAGDRTRRGLNRYPEPQSAELVEALASLYGVSPGQVLVGRGSDEGIDLLVRAFCRAGRDRVLVCPPTFAMYRFAADLQGAGVTEVPLSREDNFGLDGSAVLGACDGDTSLVFLCSPNNPTGNQLDPGEVLRIIEGLADRALVVVDEAYVEFASGPSLVDWLDRHPNLAILRTLSKAHGLAGARCGAVLASADLISLLRRMLPPYAVTTQTIDDVLEALIPANRERRREQLIQVRNERQRLARTLPGLAAVSHVWPSDSNFLLVAAHDAGRLLAAGIDAGLLVRDVRKFAGLEDCLRVTVGTPEHNDRLLAAWETA